MNTEFVKGQPAEKARVDGFCVQQCARDADGRLVSLVLAARQDAASQAETWLLAVDRSAHALRAAQAVLHLAQATQAKLVPQLINVQPWLSREAAEETLAQRALDDSAAVRALFTQAGYSWCLHVRMGEPAQAILAALADLPVAGVVLGRRGLNAAQSLLLGSVTQKVLQQAQRPVLVVP